MKKKPRILLVDQHPEWLEFARIALAEDYEVVVCDKWNELLPSSISNSQSIGWFDLVFIGLELATHNLDALKPYFKRWNFVVVFPIIQTNEALRLFFKAGAYDCAQKPYERDGLLKLVADELILAKMANGKIKNLPKSSRGKSQGIAEQLASMLNLEEH